MSIQQTSLDALLDVGRDAAPNHGVEEGDVDHALFNYLDQEYSNALSSTPGQHDAPTTALPASMYRLPSAAPQSHIPDSSVVTGSLPSMPIPQSLLQLASATPPLPIDLTETEDIVDVSVDYDHYGDRGEMGGKRRKQPHERAGWKEMDEGSRKRGKRGPRGPTTPGTPGAAASPGQTGQANPSQSQTASDYQRWDQMSAAAGPSEGQTGTSSSQQPGMAIHDANLESLQRDLEQVSGMALSGQAGQAKQHSSPQPGGEDAGQDAGRTPDEAVNDKLDRAEQNRRAQQVYRRKREERMKQLEAAAAALEPTRKVLSDTQAKLRVLAQSYEASRIEVLALQNAIIRAAEIGTNLIGADGALLVGREDVPREAKDSSSVVKALEVLEAQTRELARVRFENRP